jgi:hypothetical protein
MVSQQGDEMKFLGFEEWSGTRREVKFEAEAQLRAIVAADTAYQAESATRGGVCESSATEDAQEAAESVTKKRDARLAEIDGPRHAAAAQTHHALLEALRTAAAAFSSVYTDTRNFEDARESFGRTEGVRHGLRVTDGDINLHLDALLGRLNAILQPVAPRAATPRPPLARPDFGAMLSRFFGRA